MVAKVQINEALVKIVATPQNMEKVIDAIQTQFGKQYPTRPFFHDGDQRMIVQYLTIRMGMDDKDGKRSA